ncbi:MAG: hypothetical protein M1836_004662 [Candelina mexicana]|nr:MAG: hypothetical protein M1836_004662 [Candelina mexicana]
MKSAPKALSLRPPEALQDEGNCWFVGPLWGHHICNNRDSFVEYKNTSDDAFGLPVVGMGTVRLYAILPDKSVKVLDLTNVQYVPEAPTNSFSLLAAIKAGISWNPKRFQLRDSLTNAIMACAPLVDGLHRLQTAGGPPEAHCDSVAYEPTSKDHSRIVATTSKDHSTTAAITSSNAEEPTAEEPTSKDRFTTAAVTPSAPEARCDSAAIEPSSSSDEDRSPIAAFNDFETSLSEAYANLYAHSRALPALVRGGEASPHAPYAPEQDTSSEEGLLDEKNYNDNSKKPSLLEATEVLDLPGTTIVETPSITEKPSSLEAAKALALPGTTIHEKPSTIAASEALVLPRPLEYQRSSTPCGGASGASSSTALLSEKPFLLEATEALASPGTMIYKQDHYADHCDTEKPSLLEAAEALAMPGPIYEQDGEHDRCADHCVQKTS